MTQNSSTAPSLNETLSIGLPGLHCRFDYADKGGQISRRDVRVGRFFTTEDHKRYLEGVCVLRGDKRTFRLDRLQSSLTHVDSGAQFRPDQLMADIGSLLFLVQDKAKGSDRGATPRWQTRFAGLGLGIGIGLGLLLARVI